MSNNTNIHSCENCGAIFTVEKHSVHKCPQCNNGSHELDAVQVSNTQWDALDQSLCFDSPNIENSEPEKERTRQSEADALLELEHSFWTDHLRISGQKGCRTKTQERATILRHTEQELILQWEKWGREFFQRNHSDEPYRQQCGQSTSADETETTNAKPVAHKLRWGVCAIALPRESYYWLEDWVEHHLRAGASLVSIYDNTGSTGCMWNGDDFSSGVLQKNQRSKRKEEYGKLTAHLTDEDIQSKLRSMVKHYGADRLHIIPWQPRNPKTGEIVYGQVEGYEDFIQHRKNDLEWCAFIDIDEYLFCRPGLNIHQILEHVEDQMPDVGRIMMKAWKFRLRWNNEGPNDLREHLDHLSMRDGGEKNLVRMKDIVKADLHWYWKLTPGCRHIITHPEDLAFSHYNTTDEEMEKEEIQRLIAPRDFIVASQKPLTKLRLLL